MGGRLLAVSFFVLTLALVYSVGFFKFPRAFTLLLTVPLVIGFRHTLYLAYRTLPRDSRFVYNYVKVLLHGQRWKRKDASVVSIFEAKARRHPQDTCFFFEGKKWTFQEVLQLSNQVTNAFAARGYQKGDVVALMLANCPQLVCMWIGLARLGVTSALVNPNLRRNPLAHSVNATCGARAFVFHSSFSKAAAQIPEAVANLDLFSYGDGDFIKPGTSESDEGIDDSVLARISSLDELLEKASSDLENKYKTSYSDPLLYIYTSGTTGLPKAAVVPNSRYLFVTIASMYYFPIKRNDILYNPLPLFHSAGGVIGTGPALLFGIPTVIRRNFSASSYWEDCAKYKCTVAQYIGEMCRYVLATPPGPYDKVHNVHTIVGNGLRAAIWTKFVERFNITNVRELYASTEGNANTINMDNTVGAVGFLPRLFPSSIYPVDLVRVDPETVEPIRNEKGLCIRCSPGEPGLFIGKIRKGVPTREFHGYVDKEASNKKVICNVFSKGDSAFHTGDILVMDDLGYLYFKDRKGDTFRWKGENVSTTEVESVISKIAGMVDVIVYGVEVPGTEGRAGMAAIVNQHSSLDLVGLARKLVDHLPAYARPMFVRVVPQIDLTGTFKLKKTDLQQEGFNPTVVKDQLYFCNKAGEGYKPLTPQLYQDIITGAMRL
ncbi:long-chain fatty acid transport protein 4-like [Ischnura elegans]|uniref:long-chain fatty acid transport protein 4-like n=1 Tax=Ischnura elegans TaxID=197161 RepID=UPI001ED8B17B|nr:long-chain fatty acid transport protein 4-like [Ischnura elegans]